MAASVDNTKTGLQPIAESHEFIDLRDNAVLLGDGRKGERCDNGVT